MDNYFINGLEIFTMYDLLEYDDSDNDVKEIYDDIFEHLGNEGLVDYFKVLGENNPHVLAVTWYILKNILVKGQLPRSLKELVFVAISNENNCKYCTSVHSAMCKIINIDDHTLNQVLQKSKNLNPLRVKLAVDFSIKMALHSDSITQEDHQVLMNAGLNKGEIFELMSLVSLVNYSNTLAQGMMIAVDKKIATYLGRG